MTSFKYIKYTSVTLYKNIRLYLYDVMWIYIYSHMTSYRYIKFWRREQAREVVSIAASHRRGGLV